MMNFNSIRVVLVETSHPGNIGSTARAMKTMGLTQLCLVKPNLNPYRKAHELAAGAYDILRNATIVETLEEALQDCHLVCATSARPRDIALPGLTPYTCATHIASLPENLKTALVFGREHAGLTNEELLQAHYHVHIPSDPTFSSLNLAQAVQIVAYELRMRALTPEAQVATRPAVKLATVEDIELFYKHLEQILIQIDFLKPSNPKKLLHRLRRLFNRTQLESTEVHLLRGILTQVQKGKYKEIIS